MDDTTTDVNSIVLFKSGGASAEPATGEPAASPAVESVKAEVTEKASEPEAKAPQTRDETGKFTKAAEQPAQTDKPAQRDPTSALIAMRQRLQAAENRVRELESAGKTTPSVFDDEKAAISAHVQEATRPLREMLFTTSIEAASGRHGDKFGEAYAAFEAAAEQNPQLYDELRNSTNPGEFIFSRGTYVMKLAPHGGDIMKMLDHETGELNKAIGERDTRIKALEAEIASLKQAQVDVPESLNRQPSGAVPAREGDGVDINKIVRFKSG